MATTPSLKQRTDSRSEVPKQTPPRAGTTHRLLYCGALSFPDSRILLDGIAFTARLPPTSPNNLFESPLPLALESMRSRSLSLIGSVPLDGLHLDWTGDVHLFIHPDAELTIDFFQRHLCYDQVDEDGLTSIGVRIGWGSEYRPQDEDIIVCGRLLSNSDPTSPILQLVAARIAPPPPRPLPDPVPPRLPRPDDPSPRRPDIFSLALSQRSNKRMRDDTVQEQSGSKRPKVIPLDAKLARAKELMPRLPPRIELNRVDDSRVAAGVDHDGFRVPAKRNSKTSLADPAKPTAPKVATSAPKMLPAPDEDSSLLETVNKTTIKSVAVKVLAQSGIKKEHEEFKEVYQWTIRGVSFALRAKMSTSQIDIACIKRLVELHVDMYANGDGGSLSRAV